MFIVIHNNILGRLCLIHLIHLIDYKIVFFEKLILKIIIIMLHTNGRLYYK